MKVSLYKNKKKNEISFLLAGKCKNPLIVIYAGQAQRQTHDFQTETTYFIEY